MEVELWKLLGLMRECEFIDVYVNGKRVFYGQVFEYAVMDCESESIVRDIKLHTETNSENYTYSIMIIECR
jgi:hypothetical protein